MSPASLRKPIILSAAMLFTRKIMQGATSVWALLACEESKRLPQKHFVQMLDSRMWKDPPDVSAFKQCGRSQPWAVQGPAAHSTRSMLWLSPGAENLQKFYSNATECKYFNGN